MMGLAARFGDAFVTAWHPGLDALVDPFARLDQACTEAGRDPATLARTVGAIVTLTERAGPAPTRESLRGDPDELAARLLAFRSAGVQQVVCMLDPRDAGGLERFAPVIERVRRLDR